MFTKVVSIVLGTLLLQGSMGAQTQSQTPTHATPTPTAKYGSNPAAGRTFTHDGVKLYYEVYGAGELLLLVHGNGGSIADLQSPGRSLPQALQGDRHGQPGPVGVVQRFIP